MPRPSRRPGSRAHRSIAQRFEWPGRQGFHIVVDMRLALAATLTVRNHSVASGFQAWISTLTGTYCVDGRLVFSARMLGGAGGFAGWKGEPERACRAIADSYSSWKYIESRVGLSAGQARWHMHAGQSRARAHRGNTLGREWVCRPDRHAGTRMLNNRGLTLTVEIHQVASEFVGRTGALVHACGTIAGSRLSWKYTRSRVGLSAGHARRNPHAAQSRACTHR